MGKPIEGVLRGDGCQRPPKGFQQRVRRSRLQAPQRVFNFAPHLLYRIKVRGIGRQEENLCAPLSDQAKSGLAFVRGQVVHNNQVPRPQEGGQYLLDIDAEDFRVRRAFDGHAGSRTIHPHGPNDGGAVPVPVRSAAMDALAASSPPAQPGHIGLGAGLIQKDQPRRVERPLPSPPAPPRPDNVGPVLFAGAERLFLYVSPIFSST